jgi:hypothetical protein
MAKYPGQTPIRDSPRINELRTNSEGQTFEFEEAYYKDANTGRDMYYIEAWMVGEPARFSKPLRLESKDEDIVEMVCLDLRRMLVLAEEAARIGNLGPIGEFTYDEEEGTPQ